MRESEVSLTFVLLLIVGMFGVMTTIVPLNVKGPMLFVGGAGPGNHTTIQDAVDASGPGDIIYVYSGTYQENVLVDKPLTLVGEDRNITVIDSGGFGAALGIESDWVNVTGFNLMNAGRGIHLNVSSNCNISNNVIRNNTEGIGVEHYLTNISSNNSFVNNEILGNHNGIYIDTSTNSTIIGNKVHDNYLGIVISSSSNISIVNNHISTSYYGIDIGGSSRIEVLDNEIWDNEDGMNLEYVDNSTIAGNNVTTSLQRGFHLFKSSHNTLRDNLASGNLDYGIYLEESDNNTIELVNASMNQGVGIGLMSSNTNVISENTLWSNGGGLYVSQSYVNKVENNTLLSNLNRGIDIRSSEHNSFFGNDVIDCEYGFFVLDTAHNTFTNNTVISNRDYGIYLQNTDYSIISGNNISENDNGIALWSGSRENIIDGNLVVDNYRGIHFDGSRYNHVTHNTLSENIGGVSLSLSDNNNFSYNEIHPFAWDGFELTYSDNNTLFANNVSEGDDGITLGASHNNSIIYNHISNVSDGVRISGSAGNRLLNNNISYNEEEGILLRWSDGNILSGNEMTQNGIYIESESLQGWNTQAIDISNTVNGKPVYYWKNVTGGTIPSGAGEVILANCTGVAIQNQDLSNGTVGVQIGFSSSNRVSGSIISNNLRGGIHLYISDDNTLDGNTILSNRGREIELVYSDGNSLTNNVVIGYDDLWPLTTTAIYNWRSNNSYVAHNEISNNDVGAYFLMSRSATVTGNILTSDAIILSGSELNYWNTHSIDTSNTVNGKPVIYWKNRTSGNVPLGAGEVILANCTNVIVEDQNVSNGEVGLAIGFSSWNTIKENTFSNNWLGVYIEFSESNTIFHNNFMFNTYQAISYGSNNWDNGYPDGGNYWSNYNGSDDNSGPNQNLPGSDGIGDTHFAIPELFNADRYPLMSPYVPATAGPFNEPPECTITSPSQGSVVSGTFTVNGTASDSDGDIQWVEVRVDNGNWIIATGTDNWTYQWNTTLLENGNHTINARSYDGEDYSAEVNVTISVDNPSPPTDQGPQDDRLWLAVAVISIIVVVLLLIIYVLMRRRKVEDEPIEDPSSQEEND